MVKYRYLPCIWIRYTGSAENYNLCEHRNLQEQVVLKPMERLTKKELLFQNIDYAVEIFMIFLLSLSIFPGFLYENTGKHQWGSW